jgi:hypothetical protein
MKKALLLLTLTAGCGSTSPPPPPSGRPPIQGLTALEIEPANATLVIDGMQQAVQPYQAIGVFSDGHREDVSERVAFLVGDSTLGSFSNGTFMSTVTHGGLTNVTATAGSVLGTTGLTLMIRQRVEDPSSPAGASTKFGGTDDAARAPSVVYPPDGVLVPPNLGKLEVHFLPGAGNTLFELAFANAVTDIRVFLRCTQPTAGGCIYLPDATMWKWLSDTNRGAGAIRVSVRGTDDSGAAVGQSASVAFTVAMDAIQGGLYYWTTSNGTAIMRFDFASDKQTVAEKFVGTELTGGKCVGCHALSRDGTKLVAEAGGQDDGRLLLLDVAKSQPMVPFGTTAKSTFESWEPSGNQFVGVYGDSGATDYNLMIFNGNTGMVESSIAGTGSAANPADHPDWAPDGQHIAYVKVGRPNTLQKMGAGAIWKVDRTGAGWMPPVELVPRLDGKNRYYPAYSPDSQFLVFNESTCNAGAVGGVECNADSDPSARLWAVMAKPGASPVELVRANGGSEPLTNSFPKWSPFVFQRTGEAGSRLMWLTFSSSRKMGLRNPPPSPVPDGELPVGTLIWMAAVDPDQIGNGLDGSFPAFALPFQDLGTSNHIAQWTTTVVQPIQ